MTLFALQSYSELMALAQKGDMHNVHEYVTDIRRDAVGEKQGRYATILNFDNQQDYPLFLYGKCVGKDMGDYWARMNGRQHLAAVSSHPTIDAALQTTCTCIDYGSFCLCLSDEFAPEDLAMSHLYYMVCDYVQVVHKQLESYPQVSVPPVARQR